MKGRWRWIFLASCGPVLAGAQALPWLDGDAHQAFRQRVIALAMLYGESSGIDPAGWRVEARQLRPLPQHCAWVEVKVSRDGEPARREELRACKPGAADAR